MGVPVPLIPQGSRVVVVRAAFPLESGLPGRSGRVIDASEYRPDRYGVVLDGEETVRYFRPEELEVTQALALPPERAAARARRALP